MEELISVIVPVYNSEKTLDRCLNSILKQSYKNLEIVIVNDGSTDKSLDILKAYQEKDKRIKLFEETNKGVSCARNLGLDKVSGNYIQFVDSDDDIDLNYFKEMYALLKDNDADVAVCNNVHPFFLTYLEDRVYNMKDKSEFLEFYQHTYAPTLPWNKLMKASLIGDKKFPEDIKFDEDELFFCSILKNVNKIATTHKVLYNYFMASKENGDEEKSTLNDLINATEFWNNKTAIYYAGLLCLPHRRASFQEAIDENKIPFDNVDDLMYQRVFDYTFFAYAAYVGCHVTKEHLAIELYNNISDENFIKSVLVQEQYGLKFIDFKSNKLKKYVDKLNNYMYDAYKDIYDNKLNLRATYVAISMFAKIFIVKNTDIDNINFLNILYKDLENNSTLEAQYVNRVLK